MKPVLRIFSVLLAGGALLVSPEAREPTELEQFYLELVNRARANPNAEVARLTSLPWGDDELATPHLNEGLDAGTISSTAKPPLAFDPRLIDAASDYADLLLANEAGGHTFGNTTAESRMEAAGYVFTNPSSLGENLAVTGKIPDNPLNADAVEEHHYSLFIDANVAGRGHRKNILGASFREVGIAIRPDSDNESRFNGAFIDIQSAQDFAASAGRIFVTGIVYNDHDLNQFFTPNNGEALGGMTIEIRNAGGVLASGTTFASGGYSINLAGRSAQQLEFRVLDGSGNVFTKSFFWNGNANVKVDGRNPGFGPAGAIPDVNPPGIVYKSPRRNARLRKRSTHRGSATDDRGVTGVTYRVAGARTKNARLNAASGKWRFSLNLKSPKLRRKKVIRVIVTAVDAAGNTTKTVRKFRRR